VPRARTFPCLFATVAHCNTPATHCRQHTATQCNTMQHTCNSLQHTAASSFVSLPPFYDSKIYLCVYRCTLLCAHTYTQARKHRYICMSTHVKNIMYIRTSCMDIYTSTYIRAYIRMYVHTYIRIYIPMYVCM